MHEDVEVTSMYECYEDERAVFFVATKDGKTLGTVKLDSPPVYHGLIAADGALFMTTTAGTVVRLQ